jgi:hypothetical protein
MKTTMREKIRREPENNYSAGESAGLSTGNISVFYFRHLRCDNARIHRRGAELRFL